MAMTSADKVSLITRNLDNPDASAIRDIVEQRDMTVLYAVSAVNKPNLSLLLPLSKLADFLQAGCQVKVLLQDLPARLETSASQKAILAGRDSVLEHVIREVLSSLGAPTEKLVFVRATSFQLLRDFILDVYRLSTIVTELDAKQVLNVDISQLAESPLLSLLLPCSMALCEEHLHVDCHYGDTQLAGIFGFAEKYLTQIGYSKRIHLISPQAPRLAAVKQGEEDAELELLANTKETAKKVKGSFCEPGNVENNACLALVKEVLLPVSPTSCFTVQRKAEFGGDAVFTNYEDIKNAFASEDLHPGDLKKGVEAAINKLLEPLRSKFKEKTLQGLLRQAYPPPAPAKAELLPSQLDIRVGEITSVKLHPSSESLYVEEVSLGTETRTVISGLADTVPMDQLQGRKGIFLCNLKARKMQGVESNAMLLCASSEQGVSPLDPPAACQAGDRVMFEGCPGNPEEKLNPKKKVWETLQVDLRVSEEGVAAWKDKAMLTEAGEVTAKLRNVSIK